MAATLEALLLACKQAEARHETAYQLLEMLPSHDPAAPQWAPLWDRLKALSRALTEANATYLAAVRTQRLGAGTYEVKYIASAA